LFGFVEVTSISAANILAPKLGLLFKAFCSQSSFMLPFAKKDPVKDGEAKIRADYDELYEEMQTRFRNLED
jgi:hypothetical protein